MSELVVDFIISLDGYAAAEGWPGWWGLEGPEYLGWLEAQPERGHTALMGARTYRMFADFAASAADLRDEEAASVGSLADTPTIVFSSTLESLAWPRAELVSGDAVAAVRELKAAGDRSFVTIGSLSLCRSLLVAGLVDRFRVGVFPVITGATGSERIFDGYPDVALELVESRTFDGRIQVLDYVPRVLEGPPAKG